MKTLLAFLAAFFSPLFTRATPAAAYMAQARAMMAQARADKAAGYPCAARAAVESAMAYRAAAHAARYYA